MGVGAAAALRRARQDAIDAGRPAAVWAGLVLAGEGRAPRFRLYLGRRRSGDVPRQFCLRLFCSGSRQSRSADSGGEGQADSNG